MASKTEEAIEQRCASCAHRWRVEPEALRRLAHGGIGSAAFELVIIHCPNCRQPRKVPVPEPAQ